MPRVDTWVEEGSLRHQDDTWSGVPYANEWPVVSHERALEILRAMLSPIQRETFADAGFFDLIGSNGRIYRICDWLRWPGQVAYNVGRWRTREGWRQFGIYPNPPDSINDQGRYNFYPVGDKMLAQKINLELAADWCEDVACGLVELGVARGGLRSIHWPQDPPVIDGIDRYRELREHQQAIERWRKLMGEDR